MFRRHSVFRTWVGAVFTVLALGMFASFSLVRTTKLILKEDPNVSMITLPPAELVDLNEF